MYTKYFKQLNKKDTDIAGGKGASLGEMTSCFAKASKSKQAEIPVPQGFVVLAGAFDRFLKETDLGVEIEAALAKVNQDDLNSVEKTSKKIRDLIWDVKVPKDISDEILKEHKTLNAKLVAVRSSATAEDSSIASWAGELESFMNVTEANLLEAVKKCWSSLFTPRAIFYRYEKNLHERNISVAVVVQEMVQSEVSGICFTVHPVTEDRNQMVIEAGWGLGDAIVGGMITPDSYVIRKLKVKSARTRLVDEKLKVEEEFEIEDINVSAQKIMLVNGKKGAKEVRVPAAKQEVQKLSGKQIVELAKLCAKIEKHYGKPQDIEWAMYKNKFYVTQSRPITTL